MKNRLKEQTKNSAWEDIRRYQGHRAKNFNDEIEEIDNAIIALGSLKVNNVYFGESGIILSFYMFPKEVGVEVTIQDVGSHIFDSFIPRNVSDSYFFRSMAVGKDKQEVTSVQESLEKIIKERKYEIYTTYAGKQEDEKDGWKTYGDTKNLYTIGIQAYSPDNLA